MTFHALMQPAGNPICVLLPSRLFFRKPTDTEVDNHTAGVALAIRHSEMLTKTGIELAQQRNRIVIVDEAHDLAITQCAKRAEDRRVAESTGYSARIKNVDVGLRVELDRHAIPPVAMTGSMLRHNMTLP